MCFNPQREQDSVTAFRGENYLDVRLANSCPPLGIRQH